MRVWPSILRRFGRPADAGPASARSGRWGESVAAHHLRRAGYRVIGRRVRTAPREEIDLIVRRGDTLVFVEVKTRSGTAFGDPSEAVDRAKRRRLSRAACRYLQRLRRPPPFARFDVVEVVGRPGGPPFDIRHIENAYPLEGPLHPPGALP